LRVTVFLVMVVFLAGGWLWGQQDPAKTTKGKGSLPTYWKSIGLSDEQKTKIFSIRGEYRTKIDALRQQIVQLEKQERGELEKVLTDDQKKQLKKIIESKVPGAEGGSKDDTKKEDTKKSVEEKKE